MRFAPAAIPGIVIIEPDVHRDPRGFFLETYHAEKYRVARYFGFLSAGQPLAIPQEHAARAAASGQRPQGKLVRVIRGEIFDVAVDVRRGSPTFGKWMGITLSAENFRQSAICRRVLRRYAVVSEIAQVEYKCTDLCDPRASWVSRGTTLR
jgi:dTDP-4-dehydrorhamnose 3,5-epimerase